MTFLRPCFGRLLLAVVVAGLFFIHPVEARQDAPAGRTTVVWVSIDGMRPDYIERGDTPTFDRLMATGAYTRQLVPAFPSVTFSSHISQATGVKVREHGVPGNAFYDQTRQRTYRYPPFASLVEAEAIWFTATRQGIRTAVLDWPMAHGQRGDAQTAHNKQRFEARMTDRARLEELIETWQSDQDHPPLQLLMTWIGQPDRVGHSHGPDSDEVIQAVEQTDEMLAWFVDAAHQQWEAQAEAGDQLYLLLTTDHGMSNLHTLVHLGRLVGIDRHRGDITMVTTGSVGHIHLDQVMDEDEREALIEQAIKRAASHDFIRVWRRADLPRQWQYDHPTRTGDVVAVLDSGYTFSVRPREVTAAASAMGGPAGMHGYDPRDDPNMNGLAVFQRWPRPLGGHEIQQVHSLQLHPTVCRLLNIEPAEGAAAEPVLWE